MAEGGVKVTVMYAPYVCPTCSVPFMVPEADLESRRERGRALFCPSGHPIMLSAEGELADLRWQLDQALSGWEQERGELRSEVLELNRRLAVEKTRSLEEERVAVEEAVAAEMPPPAPPEPATEPEPTAATNWRDEVEPKECKECGETFRPGPKVNTGVWKKQEYCGAKCRMAYNSKVAKEHAREAAQGVAAGTQQAPETGSLAEAVQDAQCESRGLEAAAADKSSPPESLVQPTTPIPGHFALAKELAKQDVTTVEQFEAMTDDELLELPRVSKPQLKMLRWQIVGARIEALRRTLQDDKAFSSTEDRSELTEVSERLTPAGAVQDAQNGESVKPDVQPSDVLHSEPPTLTDPAYGGPPAPESVAEEAEAEQVVDQHARKNELPSETKPEHAPVPPPRLQAKLPDPREPKAGVSNSPFHETRQASKKDAQLSAVEGVKVGEPTVIWRGVTYPARLEELLETTGYPEKSCVWCGDALTPRLKGNGLESLQYFNMRKVCSDKCAKNRASGRSVDQARERRFVKRDTEDPIETLEEVRARTGEAPPLSEEEEKKLDEQGRRELAAVMKVCPELLEEFKRWHGITDHEPPELAEVPTDEPQQPEQRAA